MKAIRSIKRGAIPKQIKIINKTKPELAGGGLQPGVEDKVPVNLRVRVGNENMFFSDPLAVWGDSLSALTHFQIENFVSDGPCIQLHKQNGVSGVPIWSRPQSSPVQGSKVYSSKLQTGRAGLARAQQLVKPSTS